MEVGTGKGSVPPNHHSDHGAAGTQGHGKGPQSVGKPFEGCWPLAAPSATLHAADRSSDLQSEFTSCLRSINCKLKLKSAE